MKISTMTRNIIHSVASNFAREVATSLGQILLVPLYISVFSSNDYGIWLLLTSYTSFVVLADFGLSTAIIVKIQENKSGEIHVKNILWSEFKSVTRKIALFICLLVITIVFYYFKSYGHKYHELSFYLFLTFCFLTLSLQTLEQHFILYQYQILDKYDKGMKILFKFRVVEIVITYLALLMEFKMLFILILISLVRQVFIFIEKRKNFNETFLAEDHSSGNVSNLLKEIWKPAVGNGLISVSILLGIHGTFAVAGFWADSSSLVSIALARMLVSPIRLVSASLAAGSLPHLIKLDKEAEAVRRIANFNFRFALGYLSVVSFIALGVYSSSKLIWTFLSKGISDFPSTLVLLFVVSVALDAICLLRIQFPMAQNSTFRLGVIYLATTCFSLMFQPLLSEYFRLNSVPISNIVADALFLVITLALRRIFK